jgi:predicted negative regulator of RcsB-dependent stress response
VSALDAAEDVAVNGLWKVGAVLLAVLLLVTAGGMGFEWWEAAHDRDLARTDLKAEQTANSLLRSAVDTQNGAVDALAADKKAAEVRGLAAQQLAAAAGKRYDGALQALASVKATTCSDAMPAVNQLLKDIQ